MEENDSKDEPKVTRPRGLGVATGIAIGAGIGAAMENLALGMAVGVAMGFGFEAINRLKNRN